MLRLLPHDRARHDRPSFDEGGVERAPVRRAARPRTRGQSLVEFALILPIMLTLFGACIDIARVYGAWVTVEAAARDAAEQVASDAAITTNSAATTRAKQIVCTETSGLAGFVAPVGNPTACTAPTVVVACAPVSCVPSTTAPGATSVNPIATVTVTVTFPFRTIFGYPLFTQAGAWTLSSNQSYAIAQGRP
jgi:Flp pilus assembly protein TadG